MPGFVKTKEDERLWAKAKERAKEQGHEGNWAYVTGIYKQMKGGKVGKMKPDYKFKSVPTAKKSTREDAYWDNVHRKQAERVWKMHPQKGGFVNLDSWFGDVWGEIDKIYPPQGDSMGSLLVFQGKKSRADYTFPYQVKKYVPKLPQNARIVFTADGMFGGRKGELPIPKDLFKIAKCDYPGNEKVVSQMKAADRNISNKKASDPLAALNLLLTTLRVAHWNHWTTHWKVQGTPFYGDHLLFQRLYDGEEDEDTPEDDIDALAEKILAYFGNDAIDPVKQLQDQATLMTHFGKIECPYQRALAIERQLVDLITTVHKLLEQSRKLPLGLDDYLASLASSHETNMYLLRQRWDTAANRVASRYNTMGLK